MGLNDFNELITPLPLTHSVLQPFHFVSSSGIGTYIEALRHILIYDFVEFASVFSMLLLGFTVAFVLVGKGDGTIQTAGDIRWVIFNLQRSDLP